MTTKKQFIIAGNWKMNPITHKEAQTLFASYKRLARSFPSLAFTACVPAVYLEPLSRKNKESLVTLGAQNIYCEDQGSYTGAISVPMVQDSGGTTVIIGHSERRRLFGVGDELISKKIKQAIAHNMPMIVCFGEEDRDEQGQYTEELEKQLRAILTPFVNQRKNKLLTLAYEPVWAIGSGAKRAVGQDELFSTMILIKNIIASILGEHASKTIPVLYGGSVNADNAGMLATVPGVSGFLIGRASLAGDSLKAIAQSVTN